MSKRNKKYTLEEARQIIISIGYTPLFTEYINARAPLLVHCPNGHEYNLTINHAKTTKCKQCYHDSMRTSEVDLRLRYKEAGLEIISFPDGYVNANSRVEFKCSKGHITITEARNFGYGKRCSHKDCSTSRRKATMIERHGVEYAGQTQHARDVASSFMTNNNPMNDPELFHKAQTNPYRTKTFKTPSGRTLKLQGYEPRAYQQLLTEGYSEDDILTNTDVPRIRYRWNDGTAHKYYPDFYIPKDNLIVEVKSDYFWDYHLEMNLLKKDATISAGYDYRLMKYTQ